MNVFRVPDFKGHTDICYVLGRKDTYRTFAGGFTEIRVGIQFDTGDAYITWLPVFTEWWPE
jgi:hypothetical protein